MNKIKLNNNIEIPQIGVGTWTLRGETARRNVRLALEAGFRHIDTAQGYENETEVGQGISDSGVARQKIFVTTKVNTSIMRQGKQAVIDSIDESLCKLNMDYIDLLLIHWPVKDCVRHTWEESPQGINCGGWGLWLKTEDLAKMGQLLLQKGEWNGQQLIPAELVAEMSKKQVESINPGTRMEEAEGKGMTKETSDWMQGYGYQMWRCRPGCFRADGARGQYIIVVPDKNAVIAITSDNADLQGELNLVWERILPVL